MRKSLLKLCVTALALAACAEWALGQHRGGFHGGHPAPGHRAGFHHPMIHWSPTHHWLSVPMPHMTHHAAIKHPLTHHAAVQHPVAHHAAIKHALTPHLPLHHRPEAHRDHFHHLGHRSPWAVLIAPRVPAVLVRQAIAPVVRVPAVVPYPVPSPVASPTPAPVSYPVSYPAPYGAPAESPYAAAVAPQGGAAEVSPVVPSSPEKSSALQYARLLKVVNSTAEALEVSLRYETLDKDSQWIWVPGISAKDGWLGPYKLAPGQSGHLKYEDVLVYASRVRIKARGASGKTWTEAAEADLWLVAENAQGERAYQAAEAETYTYRFRPKGTR
jgi:hypothetical protein